MSRTPANPCRSKTDPAETTLFVSHGPYGIVDLGASQTVIGEQQVAELLENLPSDIRARVREVPCQTVFRFGNSSTVMCIRALLVPLAKWDVKICIVKSRTPFLISNNVFRTLELRSIQPRITVISPTWTSRCHSDCRKRSCISWISVSW